MSRVVIGSICVGWFLAGSAVGQLLPASRLGRPAANPAPLRGAVEFSTLITAQDVTGHLATEAGCRAAAGRFRDLGLRRLWLELVRDGHRADLNVLRQARDVFRKEGFVVSGALTTTWGAGFGEKDSGGYFLCYSSPETQKALAETSADACRIFDEVMYDDFLATHCRCERCTREKRDRSWAEYRCELKSRVSRDFIVGPGHRANPNAVIIIKYPQWYDKFHRFGYDVIRDTAAFDAIWVGTETRGPDTPRFGFVPTYQSANVYRWLGSIGVEKTRGGWFDPYDCTPDEYVDQAYATVFAGATELMRFNGFAILPDGPHAKLMAEFARHRPHVEELAVMLAGRSALGLLAYKPPYSTSGDEDYWFDYFGNMGVPLLAAAEFPAPQNHTTLVLTRAARHDATIDGRVLEWSAGGGSMMVTAGFLAGADRKVLDLFGIDGVETGPIDVRALRVDGADIESTRAISLGGLLSGVRAEVRVAGRADDRWLSVLTVARTAGGGFAAVLNLRTHDIGDELLMDKPVGWIDLPEPAANLVRRIALTGTGFGIEAPTRVNVHPFTGGLVGIINARDAETRVRLTLGPPWFDRSIGRLTIQPGENSVTRSADGAFALTLPPRARWTLVGPSAR